MLETKRSRKKFVEFTCISTVVLVWAYGIAWAWTAKDERGWMGTIPQEAALAYAFLVVSALLAAAIVIAAAISYIVGSISKWINKGTEE